MRRSKKGLLAALITLSLLASMVPVLAWVNMGYAPGEGVQIFTGTFRDWYVEGQNVTLFVLLWRPYSGPVPNATVTLMVEQCCHHPLFEINVTTDGKGMGTAVFRANTTGYYTVVARYRDTETSADFRVVKVYPYYFVDKKILTAINETVALKWTLMDPFTREKYTSSEPINMTILKDGRIITSTLLTPDNGVINYTTAFSETGRYEVELDGRHAATVYVMTKALEGTILAPKKVKAGESFKVDVLAVDPEEGRPYSGGLTLEARILSDNGSEVRDIPVNVVSGHGHVNMTTTKETRNIYLILKEENIILDRRWVNVYGQSQSTPRVKLKVSPQYILAKPGQSISIEVSAPNATTGRYNMTVTWYLWAGTDDTWRLPREKNTTGVYFNGTDRVIKRIRVPENAYYGVVSIGGAKAYIYTMKPKLDAWFDHVKYTYNTSTHEIEYEKNVTVNGWLRNETKDWREQWRDLYKPLSNETVYVYSVGGIYELKTRDDGRVSGSLPYIPNPKVPKAFGEEMNKVWYLMIHKSGAYDLDSVESDKVRVNVNLTGDGLRAFKYLEDEGKRTSIPMVIEFSRSAINVWDRLSIGNLRSIYWNTTELNITERLEPGKYTVSILPTGWLCGYHWCSSSSGLQHDEVFVILPKGLELKHDYTSDDPNNITVPIKLPGKGIFYFRDWSGRYYIGTTDNEGNGLLHLPWEGSTWNHYGGYFGFITENISIINIPWWFAVRITRDVIPPAVEVSVTPEVQEIGKNVTISYVATDDNGLKSVEIEVTNITDVLYNASIPLRGDRRFEGKFNFTIHGLEDYTVKVTAHDLWNHSASEIVNFFGKAVETETIELPGNGTAEINVENQTSITVSSANNSTVQMNVTVASTIENESAKFKMKAKGYEDLKYVKVETNETVSYRWVILNMTYSDEVLQKLGIDENAVTLFYWNGSEWVDLSKHVGDTITDNSPYGNLTVFDFGRDGKHNYVWANVSHLSEYALGVKLPDLRVAVIYTGPAYAGRETTINVTVENIGGSTDKEFSVALLIDGNVSKVVNVTGLGSGEKKTVSFTWIPPAEGTYTIEAVADYRNVISESNEDNNHMSTVVEVKEWTEKPASMETFSTVITLNFIHYRYYQNMEARFEKLYNQSLQEGIDNQTLSLALKHVEMAKKYYEEASKFGPILLNLGDPRIIFPLREAYLEMKKAVEILENALKETETH